MAVMTQQPDATTPAITADSPEPVAPKPFSSAPWIWGSLLAWSGGFAAFLIAYLVLEKCYGAADAVAGIAVFSIAIIGIAQFVRAASHGSNSPKGRSFDGMAKLGAVFGWSLGATGVIGAQFVGSSLPGLVISVIYTVFTLIAGVAALVALMPSLFGARRAKKVLQERKRGQGESQLQEQEQIDDLEQEREQEQVDDREHEREQEQVDEQEQKQGEARRSGPE